MKEKSVIKPLGENILIKMDSPEEKTSAGIYLPETANHDRSQIGTVIAIGESEKIKVKAGDAVVFKRYGGEEVKIDNVEYLLSNYKDVLAVIA